MAPAGGDPSRTEDLLTRWTPFVRYAAGSAARRASAAAVAARRGTRPSVRRRIRSSQSEREHGEDQDRPDGRCVQGTGPQITSSRIAAPAPRPDQPGVLAQRVGGEAAHGGRAPARPDQPRPEHHEQSEQERALRGVDQQRVAIVPGLARDGVGVRRVGERRPRPTCRQGFGSASIAIAANIRQPPTFTTALRRSDARAIAPAKQATARPSSTQTIVSNRSQPAADRRPSFVGRGELDVGDVRRQLVRGCWRAARYPRHLPEQVSQVERDGLRSWTAVVDDVEQRARAQRGWRSPRP